MKTTQAQGIDYGMGLANVDRETGIRFGVISQHSLMAEFVYEDFEAQYGPMMCPKCGNKAVDSAEECAECADMDGEYLDHGDYHCHGRNCGTATPTSFDGILIVPYSFYSDYEAYNDEAIGFTLDNSEYKAHYGNDGFGVWCEKSPYYTFARFCSPCAPGAGDLDSPIDGVTPYENQEHNFERVYCFGLECFDEDNPCPYRVFRVSDNSEVLADDTEPDTSAVG